MEYKQWKKILYEVNSYENLNPDNIIEIIKEKLAIEDKAEYEKWKGENFGVCHSFSVSHFFRKKATLLHLASYDELDNVIDNLLKIEGVVPFPILEVLTHKTMSNIGYTTELSTIMEDTTLEQGNESPTKSQSTSAL